MKGRGRGRRPPASVGRSAPRREGPEKLTGRALYVDDHPLPGALFGATFRSTIPRGKITKLELDPAFPWSEFVVVTARDVPGSNHVALMETDQPVLADGEVRHAMEPIALVAHAERARAYEALAHIRVEYEPQIAVLDLEESIHRKQALYGTDNVFKRFLIEKGDVEKGLAGAEVVVEGEYRVPHQEQAYIENNGMAAWVEDGVLVVMGSLQCPYYVHKALEGDVRPVRRARARRPGHHWRRLRRKGRVPVDDRRARGAPRLEGREARQDHLRPRRGHGGHHEAPPRDRPPPYGADARGPSRRPGRRGGDGRRCLRHALARRPVPRHAPRDRALRVRQRARPLARARHQHAAQRRLPRLRRAADPLRGRAAHGADRRGAGDRLSRAAAPERLPGRLRHRHRPGARGERGGARVAGAVREAQRLRAPARGPRALEPGEEQDLARDRPRPRPPRGGLHGGRRDVPGEPGRGLPHARGGDPRARRLHGDRAGDDDALRPGGGGRARRVRWRT